VSFIASIASIKQKLFKTATVSLLALSIGTVTLVAPIHAYAATTNIAPAAKVSFTFDDGFASAVTQAAPTLAKYGYSGTNYITTSCVGMSVAPNTCRANNDATYMTWEQITQLRNTYGWEIGSHTVTHPLMATSDPEVQPLPITQAQVVQELTQSKTTLAAHGINATAFASPYGDYSNGVLAEIAKNYGSQRGFADIGYNTWPNSDYFIKEQQVQGGVSVAKVKGYIDTAIKNNQWLVLVFHDIKTNASNSADDYEYSPGKLDQIAAYVKSKNVPVVNISYGLVASDTNLLPNASFNNGLGDGWTTDSPTAITKDTANNGSYPDSTNALKLVATTKNVHLFSPKVNVDSNATYMLKNFLNVQQLTSGEVGFYIDEYDANGNWISGQYKASERSSFVEEMNFAYKATSSTVRQASLQVFVTANSNITAYLDNSQWFPLTAVALPPAPTNLMPNSTFDNGVDTGWTTDSPSTISKDTANNGSPQNPANAIKLVGASTNKHLFSPKIGVDSTKQYTISCYLNIKQITGGVVGFYIDEYDANGNWISGQYKTDRAATMQGDVSFTYQPSSNNVKQASLQIIVSGNSNILAYLDNVQWLLPQ